MPAIQQQPYNLSRALTTSDTVNLPSNVNNGVCDAISASGAGNVVLVFPNDVTATVPVAAGQLLPVRVKRVNATSTTATGLAVHYIV